jgi:hypothetical protein
MSLQNFDLNTGQSIPFSLTSPAQTCQKKNTILREKGLFGTFFEENEYIVCVISGFRRGVNQICPLL